MPHCTWHCVRIAVFLAAVKHGGGLGGVRFVCCISGCCETWECSGRWGVA